MEEEESEEVEAKEEEDEGKVQVDPVQMRLLRKLLLPFSKKNAKKSVFYFVLAWTVL